MIAPGRRCDWFVDLKTEFNLFWKGGSPPPDFRSVKLSWYTDTTAPLYHRGAGSIYSRNAVYKALGSIDGCDKASSTVRMIPEYACPAARLLHYPSTLPFSLCHRVAPLPAGDPPLPVALLAPSIAFPPAVPVVLVFRCFLGAPPCVSLLSSLHLRPVLGVVQWDAESPRDAAEDIDAIGDRDDSPLSRIRVREGKFSNWSGVLSSRTQRSGSSIIDLNICSRCV